MYCYSKFVCRHLLVCFVKPLLALLNGCLSVIIFSKSQRRTVHLHKVLKKSLHLKISAKSDRSPSVDSLPMTLQTVGLSGRLTLPVTVCGLAKVAILPLNFHTKHTLQIYEKLSYEALNRHFCQTAVISCPSVRPR